MNNLLILFLLKISSIISASTFKGSEPTKTHFVLPRYMSSPLFSRISRSEVPRAVFLKNLLELDCIKQIYNQNNNKKPQNRFEFTKSRVQTPLRPYFKFRENVFNNNMPGLMRPNQVQGVSHPLGEGKFLLTPVNYMSLNYPRPLKHSKNWKNFPLARDFFKPNLKEGFKIQEIEKKESDINAKVQAGKIKMESRLEQEKKENLNVNSTVQDNITLSQNNENQQISEDESYSNNGETELILDVPIVVKNSTQPKGPFHFYKVSKPKIIQPYEVEEIIEEDIRVDVKNEKDDDLENLNFKEEEETYDNEMEFMNDEHETSSQKVPNNVNEVLDNSINKILKGLIQTPPEKEKINKEITGSKDEGAITTWVVSNNLKEGPNNEKNKISIIPPFLNLTNSPKYFSNNFYNEKEKFVNVNRNSDNRAKSLILQSERINSTQNTSSTQKNSEVWRLYPIENKSSEKFFISPPFSHNFENEKNLKNLEEKENKLLKTKFPSQTEPKLQLSNLFKFYNDAKPSRTEALPSLPDLFAYSMNPENESLLIPKDDFQFPKLHPNDSLFGQTFSILPQNDLDLAVEEISNTSKLSATEKSINETNISTTKTEEIEHEQKKSGLPEWDLINNRTQLNNNDYKEKNLIEFEQTSKLTTNDKVNFDLIPTTSKSEIINLDADSKNNYKKNYNQGLNNYLDEVTEQRRSDILINDAINDYEENLTENNNSLNYLKFLKDNASEKNFSINLLIPSIPTIVNDIRQGKLNSEEIFLISKAMEKYWPSILTLTNNTNFDMLPMLKMKNEKDLEKFLENSVKEENVEKTTLESIYDLTNDMYFNENYDYDYKDLYQDITVEDLDFKRKKKLRPVREVDNHLQHLKTKNAIFYGLGNRDGIKKTENHIRIKRNREDYDWRAEAIREYFESLEEERKENADNYLYDEIFYSDLPYDELMQAELVEASNFQINFQNLTTSDLRK